MSKKVHSTFVCSQCGYETSKWLGKCPECSHWNSFIEEDKTFKKLKTEDNLFDLSPQKIKEIELTSHERNATGFYEFDRVMGGGIVPGSLVLIGGEPGIGKSTLLLEVFGRLSKRNVKETFLYISGEESLSQVASRAIRMEIGSDNFLIYNETSWQKIKLQIEKYKPKFKTIIQKVNQL